MEAWLLVFGLQETHLTQTDLKEKKNLLAQVTSIILEEYLDLVVKRILLGICFFASLKLLFSLLASFSNNATKNSRLKISNLERKKPSFSE